jgi:hypothetical protein
MTRAPLDCDGSLTMTFEGHAGRLKGPQRSDGPMTANNGYPFTATCLVYRTIPSSRRFLNILPAALGSQYIAGFSDLNWPCEWLGHRHLRLARSNKMEDCIPTQQSARLCSYFQDRFRPPWAPWLPKADAALDSISLGAGPIKLGAPKNLFRALTLEHRLRHATWRWLRPHEPLCGLKDMPALQKLSGLDHLGTSEFARHVGEHCLENIRKHPLLRRWIDKRLALLDFVASPPKADPEEHDIGASLRQNIIIATALLTDGRVVEALDLAERVSAKALGAAAVSVKRVLGKLDCRLSANLMIATILTDNGAPRAGTSRVSKDNAARATELWNGYAKSGEPCLVVVAETTKANHLGFWVPMIQGKQRVHLPGAPTAFFTLAGDAVFQDDLPSLSDAFDEKLDRRWNSYMTEHFKEHMFVSLPLRLQTTAGSAVGAVLNINATPHQDDGWRRAYHREWLGAAQDRAAPFLEIAYWAAHLRRAGAPRFWPRIDSDTREWDTFPVGLDGLEEPLHLEDSDE